MRDQRKPNPKERFDGACYEGAGISLFTLEKPVMHFLSAHLQSLGQTSHRRLRRETSLDQHLGSPAFVRPGSLTSSPYAGLAGRPSFHSHSTTCIQSAFQAAPDPLSPTILGGARLWVRVTVSRFRSPKIVHLQRQSDVFLSSLPHSLSYMHTYAFHRSRFHSHCQISCSPSSSSSSSSLEV